MKDFKQDSPFRMRFKFISLFFAATFLVLVAISCKSSLYLPTEIDANNAETLKELQAGRMLYINRCGSCHTLYLPEQYTPSDWRWNLDEMKGKAKLKAPEYELILKYVLRGRP